jgi:Sap, sulfolipid-1-addressing protein
VIATSAGFALLAAISPTALLVMVIFLSSDNPRRIAMLYVVGAILMTVAMAVTVLVVLHATGLNQPRQRTPRYGLRFGLGIIALALAVFMMVRARRARAASDRAGGEGTAASDGAAKRPGLVARLTANPRPLTAFLAGLFLFAPSASFIAAVQVIATSNAPEPQIVLATAIVITLTALIVWLPLITYLAAPEATTRFLRNANGWVVAHSRTLLTGALAIAGVALVINGALGI